MPAFLGGSYGLCRLVFWGLDAGVLLNVLNPEGWTVICSLLGLGVLCVLIVRCRWSSEKIWVAVSAGESSL